MKFSGENNKSQDGNIIGALRCESSIGISHKEEDKETLVCFSMATPEPTELPKCF